MSEEDYLEVDKPIPGQNYTCISFVSPDECIKQKELFLFNKFMNQRCGEWEASIDDIIKKCSDEVKSKVEKELKEKLRIEMKFNYTPINYDPIHRPMRQDHKPLIIENGAVYGFKAKDFLKYNSRLFKKIGFIEMNRYRSIEIDSKLDFKVSKLLNRFM